jgi:hypothetical protein
MKNYLRSLPLHYAKTHGYAVPRVIIQCSICVINLENCVAAARHFKEFHPRNVPPRKRTLKTGSKQAPIAIVSHSCDNDLSISSPPSSVPVLSSYFPTVSSDVIVSSSAVLPILQKSPVKKVFPNLSQPSVCPYSTKSCPKKVSFSLPLDVSTALISPAVPLLAHGLPSSSDQPLLQSNPAILDISKISNQHELDSFYSSFFQIKSSHSSKTPPPFSLPRNEKQEAICLQKLFDKKPKRAIDKVCGNKDIPFNVTSSKCHEAMSESFGIRSIDLNVLSDLWPPLSSAELITSPILPNDVQIFLKSRCDTAPGADFIKYSRIKQLDPSGLFLSALFNKILDIGLVPSIWLQTKIVMIFKKPKDFKTGDDENFKKFRPISLTSCVYKCFSAILASRFSTWLSLTTGLSERQRAVFGRNGVLENSHLLRLLHQSKKFTKSSLQVGFIDLADAFNSVPHSVIRKALSDSGCPQAIINIILLCHEGSMASIVNSRCSNLFELNSGVKQGCPLAAILFCLVMNPVLVALEASGDGCYLSDSQSVACEAYMDDILLLSDSALGLSKLFASAEDLFLKLGLKINPQKCGIISCNAVSPTIQINGCMIPPIVKEEKYPYLGMCFSSNGPPSAKGNIEDYIKKVSLIEASLLRPDQKHRAITLFLRPAIEHSLSVSKIEWSIYEGCQNHSGENRGYEIELRSLYKNILFLPSSASDSFLYSATSVGGGGFRSLKSSVAVFRFVNSLRLLNSSDSAVQFVALDSLEKISASRFPSLPLSSAVLNFLNDSNIQKKLQLGNTGFWGEVRKAKSVLEDLTGCTLTWFFSDNLFSIEIGHPVQRKSFSPDSKNIHTILNKLIQKNFFHRWMKCPSQGRFAYCLSRSNKSSVIRDRHLSFCDWRFIFKARLSLTPCNSINHRGLPTNCRKCGADIESLAHVLNHCTVHSRFWRLRHDSIQTLLADELLRRHPSAKITINKKFPHVVSDAGTDLRPDIIIDFPTEKKVHIIDIKCTIDTPSAWAQAKILTDNKYTNISKYFLESGYTVATLNNFVISSLGSIHPANYQLLKSLQISNKASSILLEKARRSSIHWSRNIWITHVGAQKIQY